MARLVVVVLTAAVALVLPGLAEAQAPGLEIVEPEELALTYEGRASSEASIWLRNTTTRPVEVRLSALTEDKEGRKDTDSDGRARLGVEVVPRADRPTLKRLGAGSIARYRLRVRPKEGQETKDVSGVLVATPRGIGRDRARAAGASASIQLTLTKKLAIDRGVTEAIIVPFLLAFVLMAAVAKRCAGKGTKIDAWSPLPASLDFSKSFASSATAAGAVLGAILSAEVLPEQTVGQLSKEAFVALNLVFGIAIALAGLVYAALQGIDWKKDNDGKVELEAKGTVLGFLAASLITVWAVFGELGVALLATQEVGVDKGFSEVSLWVLRGLIAGAFFLMVIYTWIRVPVIVRAEPSGSAKPKTGLKKLKPRVPRRNDPRSEPVEKVSLL